MRRTTVVGVFVVSVAGTGLGLKALTGDDAGSVTATPAVTRTTGDWAEPTSSHSASTDTGVVAPAGAPTAADKLRVLVVGDSLAGGLGPVLSTQVEATGIIKVTTFYKISSGLVRPDFYNWPDVLRQEVPTAQPDVVVAQFGGNDGQAMKVGDQSFLPGSPGYAAEYASRVGAVMDYLQADGRRLIWVGLPNAESTVLRRNLEVIVGIQKAEADKRPGVRYIDSWSIFTGPDGGFAAYVIDPRDGQLKDVRAKDSFHLNKTGEEILSGYVSQEVLTEAKARGGKL